MKNVIVLILIAAVFLGASFGVNAVTAPIISANESSAAYEPLFAVMPEAENFELLYDAADAENSTLTEVPETVKAVYAETGGLGYAVELSTTQGYTGEAIEFTLAINGEGIITASQLKSYPETKDFGAEYPGTYVGQDSTLAGVQLVAGVTYSSAAYKNAVNDAFTALVANELVGAAQKSDEQLLMEVIGPAYPGIVNPAMILMYEELEGNGAAIQKCFKTLNGAGLACMVSDGESSYMAVVNLDGDVMAIDVEGQLATDRLSVDVISQVQAAGAENLSSFAEKDSARLARMLEEGAELTPLPLNGVFSTVTTAYAVNQGGETLYGFVARSYGYANEIMPMFYVLDANGAIVSMTTSEFIFHSEYFSDYTLDVDSYKAGFAGLTADTWTGEQALISGATMSSDGVSSATDDVFAAFKLLQENGGLSA